MGDVRLGGNRLRDVQYAWYGANCLERCLRETTGWEMCKVAITVWKKCVRERTGWDICIEEIYGLESTGSAVSEICNTVITDWDNCCRDEL